MPQSAERVLATPDYRSPNPKRPCFLTPKTNDFRYINQAGCLGTSDTKENWLLIGDSHADDLWAGLSSVNPEINLMQATGSGCRPLLDIKGERRCADLMRFLFTDFIPKHRFYVIPLSARWGSGNIADVRKTAKSPQALCGAGGRDRPACRIQTGSALVTGRQHAEARSFDGRPRPPRQARADRQAVR
jgi:hypothetical protein